MDPRRWRRWTAVTRLGVALGVSVALLIPVGSVAGSPRTKIGSIEVDNCKTVKRQGLRAWCGTISRPLGTGRNEIDIEFTVLLPAGVRPGDLRQPPIVAMEGGPGFSSIESAQGFADMLGPVLDDRALIVMDARGTGRSAAIDCPSLRDDGSGSIAACGRHLGREIGSYSSAAAADDLAEILKRLRLGRPILYGDSYGTFLAQVFARRHPVTALVLDGAYPTSGEDAWFDTQGNALRRALDLTCARAPACESGRTVDRLNGVLELVREQPRKLRAPGADGRRHAVTINAPALVEVAFNGTYLTPTMRELDAALGAALEGEWLPLGRLVAEVNYPGGESSPVSSYSPGQMLAVGCHDYPQLFDYGATPSRRRAQVRNAIAEQRRGHPEVYAPFTIGEYLASGWAEQEVCVTWPLRKVRPALDPRTPSLPDVPVLVISGDLDTITTQEEGQMVAESFPRSRHVIVTNGLHVNALGNPGGCAAAEVRSFVADPEAYLVAGLVGRSCDLPAIQLAPDYQANRGSITVGKALARTVADVLDRAWQSGGSEGLGLRGGYWSLRGWPKTTITLRGFKLYQDLPVSGMISWNTDSGEVRARLRVEGRSWTGCWSALDDLGPEATAVEGESCPPVVPRLEP